MISIIAGAATSFAIAINLGKLTEMPRFSVGRYPIRAGSWNAF